MKKARFAFTLIELLIVVAIIAILAAIAVPNFLEAQTRAKVSRAKSDMRSLATAIESYIVDNNKPPREWDQAIDGPLNGSTSASGIISPVLSTPIAYITTALLTDPFVRQGDNIPEDEKTFSYADCLGRKAFFEAGGGNVWFFGGSLSQDQRCTAMLENFGAYYMMSIGPDRRYDNNEAATPGGSQIQRGGISGREYILYDPTNGTNSAGNIIRSQKTSDDKQIPVSANILGPH